MTASRAVANVAVDRMGNFLAGSPNKPNRAMILTIGATTGRVAAVESMTVSMIAVLMTLTTSGTTVVRAASVKKVSTTAVSKSSEYALFIAEPNVGQVGWGVKKKEYRVIAV